MCNYLRGFALEDTGAYTLMQVYLFMGIVLMAVLGVIFKFSITGFMKEHSEEYSLLLMLGIAKKDFWGIIIKEYCKTAGKINAISILIGNFLSLIFIDTIVLKREFKKMLALAKHSVITMVFVFVLYFLIMFGTIIAERYKWKKKSLIEFWEKQNKNHENIHKYRIAYCGNPIVGVLVLVISFCLFMNYNTLYLAALIHLAGIYLLIHANGRLLKKYAMKWKHRYYKNIVVVTDLLYQYKMNAKVIFTIYVLNFLLTFIIGGLILSVNSNSNYKDRYPYDTIMLGRNLKDNADTIYKVMPGINKNGDSITAISLSNYNTLTKSENSLTDNEILYYDEAEKESFPPLDDKSEFSVEFHDEEYSYLVKAADWKVIFGENIMPELQSIVVLSDDEFTHIFDSGISEEIIATNNKKADNYIENDGKVKIWHRTQEIQTQKRENRIMILLMYIMGMFLIFEEQCVILIRQLLNRKEDIKSYQIFKMLGISHKELNKSINKKIRNILIVPGFAGALMGMVFLGTDCLYQGGMSWGFIRNYIVLLGGFLTIQYIGYQFATHYIRSYHGEI